MPLVPTWQEVEARYDDPRVHDAFLEECRRGDRLAHAARCYRDRLAARPDDAVALARQRQLVAIASAALQATTSVPRSDVRTLRKTVALCALIGLVAGFLLSPSVHADVGLGKCDGLLMGTPACFLVALLRDAGPMAHGALCAAVGALAGTVFGVAFGLTRRALRR
jgi:hypothetical protein